MLLINHIVIGQKEPIIEILFVSPVSVEIDSAVKESLIDYLNFWNDAYPTKVREYVDKVYPSLDNLDKEANKFVEDFSLGKLITVEEAVNLGEMLIFDEIKFNITFIDTQYSNLTNFYEYITANKNLEFIINIDSVRVKEYKESFFIDADFNFYDVKRKKNYTSFNKEKIFDFTYDEIFVSMMPKIGFANPLKTYRKVIGRCTTPIYNSYVVAKRNYDKSN